MTLELYQRVVNEKRESAKFLSRADKQPLKHGPVSSPTIDDPLKVLKLRFAKGEITKEEYEEMRKMLESLFQLSCQMMHRMTGTNQCEDKSLAST